MRVRGDTPTDLRFRVTCQHIQQVRGGRRVRGDRGPDRGMLIGAENQQRLW